MVMPRESAFLPTIKCSSCGNEVEISLMGEHECVGDDDLPPMPNNALQMQSQFRDSYTNSSEKAGPRPPPLDVTAANHQYSAHDALTPALSTSNSHQLPDGDSSSFPATHKYIQASLPQSAKPSLPTQRTGGYGGFAGNESMQTPPLESPWDKDDLPRPPLSQRQPPFTNQPFPRRKESLDTTRGSMDRPSTAHVYSRSNTASPGFPAPGAARLNGYGGFSSQDSSLHRTATPPSTGSLLSRSETFPQPSMSFESASWRAPASAVPSERLRHDSPFQEGRRPSMGPDTSRQPPPRTSLIRPSTAGTPGTRIDLAAEFGVGNPYHTPSDSGSSGYSTFSSHASHSSPHTSPARSQGPGKPPDSTQLQVLMTDVESAMNDLHVGRDLRQPLRTPSPLVDSANKTAYSYSPEAFRPPPLAGMYRTQSPQHDAHLQSSHSAPALMNGPDPRNPSFPALRKGSVDPVRHRGPCKACHAPITGKSVSSADGRLTGKYHKACFVCTACAQPFASAEFYVLNDQPYCELHYHDLNGSLCGGCGTGIEGQYLEDETCIKYHTGCFCCRDCGMVLSDGYFELDGFPYCERDAMQRTAPVHHQPPSPLSYGHGFPRGEPSPLGPGARSPHGATGYQTGGRSGLRPTAAAGMGQPPYGTSKAASRLAPHSQQPRLNKRMTRLGNM